MQEDYSEEEKSEGTGLWYKTKGTKLEFGAQLSKNELRAGLF